MQNRAIRLMASKLAVAGIIEGNFTDEGLAAMSDCADMTTALARELTQGIRDEVEDLSEVFKKMAILKPAAAEETVAGNEEDAAEVAEDTVIVDIAPAVDDTAELTMYGTSTPVTSGILPCVNSTRPAKAYGITADEMDAILRDLFEESIAA